MQISIFADVPVPVSVPRPPRPPARARRLARALRDWLTTPEVPEVHRRNLRRIRKLEGVELSTWLGHRGRGNDAVELKGRLGAVEKAMADRIGAQRAGADDEIPAMWEVVQRHVESLIRWLEALTVVPQPTGRSPVTSARPKQPAMVAASGGRGATGVAANSPLSPGAARRLSVDSAKVSLEYRVGRKVVRGQLKSTLRFKLLHYLSRRPGHRFNARQLCGVVWPSNAQLTDHTLASNLSLLRRDLRRLPGDVRLWQDLAARVRMEMNAVLLDLAT